MSRRTLAEAIAANVTKAMTAAGESLSTVSEATDIPVADLEARLEGREEFQVSELVTVGGFLHIRASSLLEGAAA